jgi:RNA polymerase sigma-70 factor (ECF subfamily)
MTTVSERFIAARPRLLRLAYSQLGDLGEAEDVVQEAWLRLERSDAAQIRDLDAWLTTVVARLALDALRSARARRELYVGPWLPEPLVASSEADPADRVTLDEAVSYALLAVLEQLPPGERTAFVLHDVFGMPFEQVADVVGRTPAAVRQLASRGRKHVEAERPRQPVSGDEHRRVVEAFGRAALAGDLDALLEVLDPDVVFTADGGGRAIAARKPLHGADRVARTWTKITASVGPTAARTVIDVNGRAGLLVDQGEAGRTVLAFEIDGGRITRIDVIRNPDKLPSLADARGGVR